MTRILFVRFLTTIIITLISQSILCILPSLFANKNNDASFSYHKFRGPVSGEIKEVVIPHRNYPQYQTLDFVAKPDYAYVYGVEDPLSGNSQNHREIRDGDAVRGEYRVHQPDGMIRVVKYTADGANGFRADIHYENA